MKAEYPRLYLNVDNMGEITGDDSVAHVWLVTGQWDLEEGDEDPGSFDTEQHESKEGALESAISYAKYAVDLEGIHAGVVLDAGNEVFYYDTEGGHG